MHFGYNNPNVVYRPSMDSMQLISVTDEKDIIVTVSESDMKWEKQCSVCKRVAKGCLV